MVIPILFALPPLTALSLIIYAIKLTDQIESDRIDKFQNTDSTESMTWVDSERIEKV